MKLGNDDAPARDRRLISAHFQARVPAVIAAWTASVRADPAIATGRALPRVQLEDHLPLWLQAFADVLGAPLRPDEPASDSEDDHDAEAHGLQRWQQGYDLREVTREWGCLHRCLVVELEAFGRAHADLHPDSLAEARLKLAEQISEATSESADEYFRLEQMEAAGNVQDLEGAVTSLRAVESARAELWQQAAHDLRGNLGVVSQAADGLNLREIPAERRQHVLAILRNNVASLRSLLDDVTGLARLQAGQEQREVGRFDAADLLCRLCDDLRPVAEAKGLELRVHGEPSLTIEGDRVKIRRIAQNLLLNALKYTRSGGVDVTWGEGGAEDPDRWVLSVADSGPGFHAGPGAPLASAVSEATEQARSLTGEAAEPAPPDTRDTVQVAGEGIGLAIVKRLCELLNGTMELESARDQGSTFHIRLPRRYPPSSG